MLLSFSVTAEKLCEIFVSFVFTIKSNAIDQIVSLSSDNSLVMQNQTQRYKHIPGQLLLSYYCTRTSVCLCVRPPLWRAWKPQSVHTCTPNTTYMYSLFFKGVVHLNDKTENIYSSSSVQIYINVPPRNTKMLSKIIFLLFYHIMNLRTVNNNNDYDDNTKTKNYIILLTYRYILI